MGKKDSIALHPEHGVNPMLAQCPLCGGDAGIVLLGYNKGEKAPHKGVVPGMECESCTNSKKVGILLVEVRDGEAAEKPKNPFRTGRMFVVSEDFARRTFQGPEAEAMLSHRVAFMEESLIRTMGLDKVEPSRGRFDNGKQVPDFTKGEP